MKFKKLMRQIGHRGAFLLFLSLLDFLYGYALLVSPDPHFRYVMPLQAWAAIWMATGLVTLTGAFMKRDRVPYGIAATVKAGWATVWVRIWMFNSPIHMAWANVALWAAFSGIIVVISTWPEVRRTKRNNGEARELWTARLSFLSYWQY